MRANKRSLKRPKMINFDKTKKVENTKIQKFKWDILSDFQTQCFISVDSQKTSRFTYSAVTAKRIRETLKSETERNSF